MAHQGLHLKRLFPWFALDCNCQHFASGRGQQVCGTNTHTETQKHTNGKFMASQNHSKLRGLARLIRTLLDTLIGYRHPPSTLQLTFLISGRTVTSHRSPPPVNQRPWSCSHFGCGSKSTFIILQLTLTCYGWGQYWVAWMNKVPCLLLRPNC